jgi:predicted rRNA methylase YqxC with S4 and FtsJ domains
VAGCLSGLGFTVVGTRPSPVTGGDGNHEFLIGATASPAAGQAGQNDA